MAVESLEKIKSYANKKVKNPTDFRMDLEELSNGELIVFYSYV